MTFGDSNTYGSVPFDQSGARLRYEEGTRWPTVAHEKLGAGWHLVEEGLPGRTTAYACPIMGPHMDGQLGLRIALQSHGPIDVLTIMLGTNDQKTHFGLTAEAIGGGLAGLLAIAMSDEYQMRHDGFKVLLICPPPVIEQRTMAPQFLGAAAKSAAMPGLCRTLAENWNATFVDAGDLISASATDGVHFEADSHVTLGNAIGHTVESL